MTDSRPIAGSEGRLVGLDRHDAGMTGSEKR